MPKIPQPLLDFDSARVKLSAHSGCNCNWRRYICIYSARPSISLQLAPSRTAPISTTCRATQFPASGTPLGTLPLPSGVGKHRLGPALRRLLHATCQDHCRLPALRSPFCTARSASSNNSSRCPTSNMVVRGEGSIASWNRRISRLVGSNHFPRKKLRVGHN